MGLWVLCAMASKNPRIRSGPSQPAGFSPLNFHFNFIVSITVEDPSPNRDAFASTKMSIPESCNRWVVHASTTTLFDPCPCVQKEAIFSICCRKKNQLFSVKVEMVIAVHM